MQALKQDNSYPPFMYLSKEEREFKIQFQKEHSIINIIGWSVHDTLHQCYEKLLLEIKHHFNEASTLICNIKYELFNTTTIKYLFKLIKLLNSHSNDGKEVKINWHAADHDLDMIETGADFQEFCKFDFSIVVN